MVLNLCLDAKIKAAVPTSLFIKTVVTMRIILFVAFVFTFLGSVFHVTPYIVKFRLVWSFYADWLPIVTAQLERRFAHVWVPG